MDQPRASGLGQSTQHLGLTFASSLALALMTAAGAVHYAFGRPTGSGAGSSPNAPKSEQVNPNLLPMKCTHHQIFDNLERYDTVYSPSYGHGCLFDAPLGKGITIAGAVIAIAIYAGMFFVLIIDFCYHDWLWCIGVDIEGEVGHPAVVDIKGEIVHPAMDGEANADVDI
ncbi:hypothetical protein LXL04_009925 [Taraxacum kok-saghyz]